MYYHKQTKSNDRGEHGNCLATSLACLLEIKIGDVPEFEEMARKEWKPSLKRWLADLGYEVLSYKEPPAGVAMAIGWSINGILHAVIVKDGLFHHDPHPENLFLKRIRDYWVLSELK